jgi:hypothetical protein
MQAHQRLRYASVVDVAFDINAEVVVAELLTSGARLDAREVHAVRTANSFKIASSAPG